MRFRKSIKLAPGIRMNLSGSGLSWTLGPRGASIGIGRRGSYLNTGIPGTGLYSRTRLSHNGGTRGPSVTPTTTFRATVSVSDEGLLNFIDESGNPLSESRINLLKKQQGDAIRELIQTKCDEINAQTEALGEIHLYTPDPKITPTYDSKPFDEALPNEPRPKPRGFLGWLFTWVAARIEKENKAAHAAYLQRLSAWQTAKSSFEAQEALRRQLVNDVVAGQVAAMEKLLGEVLQDIVWPRETLVSFEISDDGQQVELAVDLPEIEDMPTKVASVPQRGYRLSVKEMGATAVQKLYMRHVHAVGFRLIGEAFAMLPSVQTVVLSAYTKRPARATGQIVDEYLYSVRVARSAWQEINFDNLAALDVVEAFDRFELRRAMTKTGVFKPVEPLAKASGSNSAVGGQFQLPS